jgi:hypothetical protein
MKFLAVVMSLYAADPSPPIDCEMIRAKIAEHGKTVVYAWALANGYTLRDITRIRKRCGI